MYVQYISIYKHMFALYVYVYIWISTSSGSPLARSLTKAHMSSLNPLGNRAHLENRGLQRPHVGLAPVYVPEWRLSCKSRPVAHTIHTNINVYMYTMYTHTDADSDIDSDKDIDVNVDISIDTEIG